MESEKLGKDYVRMRILNVYSTFAWKKDDHNESVFLSVRKFKHVAFYLPD